MGERKVAHLKVAGKSAVKSVAGSITKCLEEGNVVEITTLGAGSTNQAVKGLAMARGFVATKGRDLVVRPGFDTVEIDGEKKTCIKFFVTME